MTAAEQPYFSPAIIKEVDMNTILKALKRNSSTFLSVIAIFGVAATAVIAAKETPKAIKLLENAEKEHNGAMNIKDKIVIIAPTYAPALISGVLTAVCIFGANVLNKRQQALITSAYALLNNNYKKYISKLKELYGEDAHENITTAIAVEKAKGISIYATSLVIGDETLGFDDIDEEYHVFYDGYSDRYFESTINKVLQAEYHLNRNFAIGGDVTLNDFYVFLGIDKTEGGDSIGWSCLCGYCWIDFNNYCSSLDDGTKCYVISPVFSPDCFDEMEE